MKSRTNWVKTPLLLLLSAGLISQSAAFAIDDDIIAPRPHDVYLQSIMSLLSERDLRPEEMSKLSAYIAEHPDEAEGHLVLSKAYNRMGLDNLYADELVKAWRKSPETLLYFLAALKVYAQSDDQSKFSTLVDEAYKSYGNNARVLGRLGKTFQSNNQSELAFRFLKRALELEPNNVELLSDYCMTLLAQKKYDQLLIASKSLDKDPQLVPLSCLLNGVAYYNLHNTKKALSYLSQAYSTNYTRPEVAEAYYDALVMDGNYKAAVEPAILALAMQPTGSKHLDSLKAKVKPILGMASAHDLEAGIKKVSSLLPPGKPLAFFYFALADILDKSGRILPAGNLFKTGLQMFPYGRAYMRLANDLEILGTVDDAQILAYYNQAVLMTPGDKEVEAHYLRMKARSPVRQTDLALRLKLAINSFKYR